MVRAADLPADDEGPSADLLLGGGLLAGLGGGAVIGWAVSRRRRADPHRGDPDRDGDTARGDDAAGERPAERTRGAGGWTFDGRTPDPDAGTDRTATEPAAPVGSR